MAITRCQPAYPKYQHLKNKRYILLATLEQINMRLSVNNIIKHQRFRYYHFIIEVSAGFFVCDTSILANNRH